MKRDRYGYKVCYREQGTYEWIRHFVAYTYRQSKDYVACCIRYPPVARDDGHTLHNPVWRICPITHNDVLLGIWRECPF